MTAVQQADSSVENVNKKREREREKCGMNTNIRVCLYPEKDASFRVSIEDILLLQK